MKISYNIETLFQDKDPCESMRLLNQHGMNIIEFWSCHDKDVKKIKETADELGMEVASVVVRPESLLDLSKREQAMQWFEDTVKYADFLGAKLMVHTVGFESEGLSREEMRKNLVDGLRACIPILEEYQITTAIEPLNTKIEADGLQGYYLNTSEEAFEIVKEINHPLVKVCYDIYHIQIMEGHVISRMLDNLPFIAHIQAAGAPGRHELYLGELNYDNIFEAIKQSDYEGYVGIEYFPTHDPIHDLAEIHKKHHTE